MSRTGKILSWQAGKKLLAVDPGANDCRLASLLHCPITQPFQSGPVWSPLRNGVECLSAFQSVVVGAALANKGCLGRKEIAIKIEEIPGKRLVACMAIAFCGSFLYTIVGPTFGKAAEAGEGSELSVHFALMTFVFLAGAVPVVVYFIRLGWGRDEQGIRKKKYHPDLYLPHKGGMLRPYAWAGACIVFLNAALFATRPLYDEGLPVGIAILIGWSSSSWLAMSQIWPDKKARRQLRRGEITVRQVWARRVWIPLFGVFQLAGVTLAALSWQARSQSSAKVDWELLRNPWVIFMVAGAMVGAHVMHYNKELRHRELKAFATISKGAKPDVSVERFLTAKIMLYCSLVPLAFSAAGTVVFVVLDGLPKFHRSQALPWMALMAVGSVGTRLNQFANILGWPPLNGFPIAAAALFSFPLWNWWLQGLAITGGQVLGAAITFTFALLVLFTLKEVRDPVMRWMRIKE